MGALRCMLSFNCQHECNETHVVLQLSTCVHWDVCCPLTVNMSALRCMLPFKRQHECIEMHVFLSTWCIENPTWQSCIPRASWKQQRDEKRRRPRENGPPLTHREGPSLLGASCERSRLNNAAKFTPRLIHASWITLQMETSLNSIASVTRCVSCGTDTALILECPLHQICVVSFSSV